MSNVMRDDLWNMGLALEEAEKAYKLNEVPIGALVVSQDHGEILAKSFNLKESTYNPCGHAEILALTQAGKGQHNWRLNDCTIYVTLEPCIMCMGAMVQSRVKRLVFGAYDKKGGAFSLGHHLNRDKRLNHTFSIVGGIRHFECSKLLSTFFREKRATFKLKRSNHQ